MYLSSTLAFEIAATIINGVHCIRAIEPLTDDELNSNTHCNILQRFLEWAAYYEVVNTVEICIGISYAKLLFNALQNNCPESPKSNIFDHQDLILSIVGFALATKGPMGRDRAFDNLSFCKLYNHAADITLDEKKLLKYFNIEMIKALKLIGYYLPRLGDEIQDIGCCFFEENVTYTTFEDLKINLSPPVIDNKIIRAQAIQKEIQTMTSEQRRDLVLNERKTFSQKQQQDIEIEEKNQIEEKKRIEEINRIEKNPDMLAFYFNNFKINNLSPEIVIRSTSPKKSDWS